MARQEKEVTRAAIETATIKLFRKKGYKDISIDNIAADANISKRTLYKYYPSKLALFMSIFEGNLKKIMTDEISDPYEGLNFEQTLVKMLERLYQFTGENIGFMRLFWMLGNNCIEGDIPEELRRHVYALNNKIMENASQLLQSKGPSGLFSGMSTTLITQMFSAINKGIYMQVEKESGVGIESVSQEELFGIFRKVLCFCAEDGNIQMKSI